MHAGMTPMQGQIYQTSFKICPNLNAYKKAVEFRILLLKNEIMHVT